MDRLTNITDTTTKWEAEFRHHKFVRSRYTQQGVFTHNGKCKCSYDFEDFDKDHEKILMAVDGKGSLRDGNMNLITKDTVHAMKSPLNDAPAGLFHNTFVMYNDLCLLQLRNVAKIQKLQALDDKLKQVNPPKDDTVRKLYLCSYDLDSENACGFGAEWGVCSWGVLGTKNSESLAE